MDKKYDFKKAEREMQKLWKDEEIYKYQYGKVGEIFSIDTPPPTVSGSLHIGHIFSYTQAEIIARFKRMQGFDVFYPFGFDDNGLPTERLVEKDQKIRAIDMPRSAFTEKCLDTIKIYEDDFKKIWQELGFSVDWSLQYQTISSSIQKISQESFLELVKKEKAYSKESPVLWCTECQTSIAQAELETKECETTFNYLAFKVGEEKLIIATTRPELLYSCVCIFVNPEDTRYSQYIGNMAKVPLYDFEVPILTNEEVSIDKGTGAVMCATFGDMTDALWYESYGLPYKESILANGKIDKEVKIIGGMSVKGARATIIECLREEGLLVKEENLAHHVATHERCGKEVEIRLSKQWYINLLSEKERFLSAADEINWYPEYMKGRYQNWVLNLKWDWCISRQRYFGVPFPVWYCKECNRPIFAAKEQLPVNPLEDRPIKYCPCGCKEVIPETAVLDTWATSSLTPFINHKAGGNLPMGMRTQAHEIIRTWAFYTIVKSLYHTGKIPWKDIMISGFVLAKPGEKISKSKGNGGGSPAYLIETHSADAIRYWAPSAKLGTDTFFSENDLKEAKRCLTKLWNASKFAAMHLEDFHKIDQPELLPIDRWVLERVKDTRIKVIGLLNEYEIGQARHEIDELFWRDFCDYYIEIVKERLYQPEKHGVKEQYSGVYALYYSLLEILKLYAIYIPHITDYIYGQIFKKYELKESIHQMRWEQDMATNYTLLEFGYAIQEIIGTVRKQKSELQLSLKDEIEEVIIKCPHKLVKYFKSTENDIRACTNARRIIYRN